MTVELNMEDYELDRADTPVTASTTFYRDMDFTLNYPDETIIRDRTISIFCHQIQNKNYNASANVFF